MRKQKFQWKSFHSHATCTNGRKILAPWRPCGDTAKFTAVVFAASASLGHRRRLLATRSSKAPPHHHHQFTTATPAPTVTPPPSHHRHTSAHRHTTTHTTPPTNQLNRGSHQCQLAYPRWDSNQQPPPLEGGVVSIRPHWQLKTVALTKAHKN